MKFMALEFIEAIYPADKVSQDYLRDFCLNTPSAINRLEKLLNYLNLSEFPIFVLIKILQSDIGFERLYALLDSKLLSNAIITSLGVTILLLRTCSNRLYDMIKNALFSIESDRQKTKFIEAMLQNHKIFDEKLNDAAFFEELSLQKSPYQWLLLIDTLKKF